MIPKIPGKKLDHNGIKIEFMGQIGEFIPPQRLDHRFVMIY